VSATPCRACSSMESWRLMLSKSVFKICEFLGCSEMSKTSRVLGIAYWSTGGKGMSYAGPEVLEGTRDPWGWVSLQGAPWVTVVPLAPNWFLTGLKTSLLRDTKRIANVSHLVAARHATSVRYDAERLARNSRFCRTVGSFWSTAPRRRRPGNGAFQPW